VNKSELIDAIAKHADISKAAAGRALDATVNSIRLVLRRQAHGPPGPQSAHWRGDQDQGGAGTEVPGWKSAEGFGKLIHSAAGRGSAAGPQ
jgi:hypothetical protein